MTNACRSASEGAAVIAVRNYEGGPRLDVRGQGKPVVIVHGGPGMDYSYMLKGLESLQQLFKLNYYEQLPRIGQAADDVSAQDQVDELVGVLQDVQGPGEDKVRVLAHSWGTYLALEASREAGDLMSHLVLVNPVPLTFARLTEAGNVLMSRVEPADAEEMERLEGLGTEEAGQEGKRLVDYAYLAASNRGRIHPRFDRYNPAVNGPILGSVEGYDQTSIIHSLTGIRLSLILGDSDYLTSEGVKELLPVSRFTHALENCGHFPFDEQSEALIDALRVALE